MHKLHQTGSPKATCRRRR